MRNEIDYVSTFIATILITFPVWLALFENIVLRIVGIIYAILINWILMDMYEMRKYQ